MQKTMENWDPNRIQTYMQKTKVSILIPKHEKGQTPRKMYQQADGTEI